MNKRFENIDKEELKELYQEAKQQFEDDIRKAYLEEIRRVIREE